MKPEYQLAWFHCPLPPEAVPDSFGIVTACNPFGRSLPSADNAVRTEALRRRLDALGVQHFPVAGGSRDGTHLEPGFGVVGLSVEQVKGLGREFAQDAIFWVNAGDVFLNPCKSDPPRPVGRWSELLFGRETDSRA